MKRISPFQWLPLAAILGALAVLGSGCATRWKPLNGFADHPSELPLQQAYVFQASPIDRTLKAMLARWAMDSGMTLEYRHHSDFTLHRPVALIRTTRLQDALEQLQSASGSRIALGIKRDAIVAGMPEAKAGMATVPARSRQRRGESRGIEAARAGTP